jgi:hypothetical protein
VRRALVLVAVVALAACGGNRGNRLSKGEYASRANAICAQFNREVRSFGSAATLKGLARLSERTLPALDSATRRLRELRPPKDEEATARQWLASLELLHADVEKILRRAQANDLHGVRRAVPGATRDNARSDRLADRLGATTCSKNQSG